LTVILHFLFLLSLIHMSCPQAKLARPFYLNQAICVVYLTQYIGRGDVGKFPQGSALSNQVQRCLVNGYHIRGGEDAMSGTTGKPRRRQHSHMTASHPERN